MEEHVVLALLHEASSARAKGSELENLTRVLRLQSKGAWLEEGRAVASSGPCKAAAGAFLKWPAMSSACRLKLLLKSSSSCKQSNGFVFRLRRKQYNTA